MKNSLATLRLDYVDMYLMHWPIALKVGYISATGLTTTTTAVSEK